MISTIVIAEYPPDATVRERKNFARFLPGYESSFCHLKSGNVFVKFVSPDFAQSALQLVAAVPYDLDDAAGWPVKVSMAKRDLEIRDEPVWEGHSLVIPGQGKGMSKGSSTSAAAGATTWYPPASGGAPKPLAAGADDIDTVAVLRLAEQALTAETVNETLGIFPGFVVCQYNSKIDACFVKFSGPQAARSGCQRAVAVGLTAQMARRNLAVPGETASVLAAQMTREASWSSYGTADYGSWGSSPATAEGGADWWPSSGAARSMASEPPAKRFCPSAGEGTGELVDTLAVTRVATNGLTPEAVNATFADMDGFVATQYNERIDGCFVKFRDHACAVAARQTAAGTGVPVDLARRSLAIR